MMNEVGNAPGQPWMWLYTFWYQMPPFSTSDNADAQIWAPDDAADGRAPAGSVHPGPSLDPPADPDSPGWSGATTTAG